MDIGILCRYTRIVNPKEERLSLQDRGIKKGFLQKVILEWHREGCLAASVFELFDHWWPRLGMRVTSQITISGEQASTVLVPGLKSVLSFPPCTWHQRNAAWECAVLRNVDTRNTVASSVHRGAWWTESGGVPPPSVIPDDTPLWARTAPREMNGILKMWTIFWKSCLLSSQYST